MVTENGSDQAPPPPPASLWGSREDEKVFYMVRHPWEWVMKCLQRAQTMTQVGSIPELPSARVAATPEGTPGVNTPSSTPAARRRRQNRRTNRPSTLKIEIADQSTGVLMYGVHGSSSAFDGLEDKDELVRTLQRCRCENLGLSPPSILINWDVTKEECLNVVGKQLPALENNKAESIVAVLKEPMGSQGKGIFFVKDAAEIHAIIDEQRERAMAEPSFLDNLISDKGRIPSWVLQAEVVPSLLIKGNRKFHIRSYVVLLEQPHLTDLLDIFMFCRHEVRIAAVPVEDTGTERDPRSHITNGALSKHTERVLINEVEELTSRNIPEALETFIAEVFGKHLLPDISRRVGMSLNEDDNSANIRKFCLAGLDLMVTEDNRIYLLEANVNPAAPPEDTVTEGFREHLIGFMEDLMELVTSGQPPPTFVPVGDILVKKGLIQE